MRWADRPEAEVVAAAVDGDRAAFGELWVRHYPAVELFVFGRCGNRHLAEDLAAEAFTRAFRSVSTYEDTGRPYVAFVIAVAKNLVADHFKSAAVRKTIWWAIAGPDYGRESAFSGFDEVDNDRLVNPEAAAVMSETSFQVRQALAALKSPEQAEVLRMRHLDDMSIAEVAAALGIPEGAVKARAWRGCRQLTKTLREYA
jgi:RNA polymerase sigma-70 factor (ECF subfamily)